MRLNFTKMRIVSRKVQKDFDKSLSVSSQYDRMVYFNKPFDLRSQAFEPLALQKSGIMMKNRQKQMRDSRECIRFVRLQIQDLLDSKLKFTLSEPLLKLILNLNIIVLERRQFVEDFFTNGKISFRGDEFSQGIQVQMTVIGRVDKFRNV